MLAWSRLESWLAVLVSVLLVTGALGHWWLDRRYGGTGGGPVVLEPIAAAASAAGVEASAGGAGRAASGEASKAPGEDAAGPGLDAAATGTGTSPAPCPEDPLTAVGGSTDTRIDINRAQPAELEQLPGIGPALARRIVEYRESWGPFTAVHDILEVPGIGPAKFNAIQDLIKVE